MEIALGRNSEGIDRNVKHIGVRHQAFVSFTVYEDDSLRG